MNSGVLKSLTYPDGIPTHGADPHGQGSGGGSLLGSAVKVPARSLHHNEGAGPDRLTWGGDHTLFGVGVSGRDPLFDIGCTLSMPIIFAANLAKRSLE
jgi:hypothetical protein